MPILESLGVDFLVVGWENFHNLLKRADTEVGNVGKTAGTAGGTIGGVLTHALGNLLASAAETAIGALVGVGRELQNTARESVNLATDFEAQVALLDIAAGDAAKQLGSLHDAAIAVGGDADLLGVSATGAADAMTGLYKAGLTTTEVFGDLEGYLAGTAELGGALRAAIDLAAASELDMVQASDLAAVALASFGGELETEAERAEFVNQVMNNFVQTADASVAEVGGLADAMKNIGPVAGGLGLEIEDVNLALGILSTRGINGAEAGTALKSALLNMQRQTGDVVDGLRDLNVELYDADGNFVGLESVVAQFEAGLAGLTQEQRNQYIQTIAGSYGMNAFNALLSEGTEGWNEMSAAVENAATTQEIAAKRAETLAGKQEALDGQLETLKIQFGEALLPALGEFVTFLSEMLDKYGPQLQTFFEGLGKALESLAGFLVSVATDGDTLNDWLAQMPEPMQQVVDFLFNDLQPAFDEVWTFVKDIVKKFIDWYTENLPLIEANTQTFVDFFITIQPALDNAWEIIKGIIGGALDFILDSLTLLTLLFTDDWEGFWQTVQDMATTIWDTIKLVWSEFLEGVLNVLGTNTEEFVSVWEQNWESFKEILAQAWELITTNIEEAWQGIVDFFTGAYESFIETWQGNWESAQEILGEIWEAIKEVLSGYIQEMFERMGLDLDEMRENWRLIWEDVNLILTEILTRISDFISEQLEVIRTFWTEVWTAISTFVAEKWEEISTVIEEKILAVKKKLSTETDAVKKDWQERWLEIRDKLTEIWEEIVTAVTEKFAAVRTAVTEGVNDVLKWLGDQVEKFKSIGSDLIGGVADGIAQAAGKLVTAATDAVRGALDAAKAFLITGSPSRRAAAEVGVPTGLGIAQGLAQTMPVIQQQMVAAVGRPLQSVTNITQNMQRSYNLTTQSLTRPGALAMEFSALEFASR